MREEKAVYQLEAVSVDRPVSLQQSSAQLITVNISPAESDLSTCHSLTSKYNKATLLSWRKYILDKKVFINIASPSRPEHSGH